MPLSRIFGPILFAMVAWAGVGLPAHAQADLDDCIEGLRATSYATYDLAIHYCSAVIREGRIPAEGLGDAVAAGLLARGSSPRTHLPGANPSGMLGAS